MLAARAYPGKRQFELEDVPIPDIGPREVLVKVHAAGLTRGMLALWRDRGMIKLLPATLGTEAAGEVAATGSECFGARVGSRVRMHAVVSCGRCRECAAGHARMCASAFLIGHAIYDEVAMPAYARYHNGGLAEYVRVPIENIDLIPDGVSYEAASKIHVTAVAYRTVKETGVGLGETLVVTGATGATGAGAIAAAGLLGIGKVIAISRTAANLERIVALAPELVVPLALESLPSNWRETRALTSAIRDLAGPRGVAGFADFLPAEGAATAQAIMALRRAGRAVLSGGNRETLVLPYGAFRLEFLSVSSSNGFERSDAIDLMNAIQAGRYDIERLITNRHPLKEVNEAVADIDQRRGNPLLVAIEVASV